MRNFDWKNGTRLFFFINYSEWKRTATTMFQWDLIPTYNEMAQRAIAERSHCANDGTCAALYSLNVFNMTISAARWAHWRPRLFALLGSRANRLVDAHALFFVSRHCNLGTTRDCLHFTAEARFLTGVGRILRLTLDISCARSRHLPVPSS